MNQPINLPTSVVLFLGTLTDRELVMLRLVAQGFSSEEIADTCFIATSTVNTHRRNIRDKWAAEGLKQGTGKSAGRDLVRTVLPYL